MLFCASRVHIFVRMSSYLVSLCGNILLCVEFVADSPYCRQTPSRMIFDFFAKPLDMDVDSPRISDILIAPYFIEQLLSCKYLIR